MEVKKKDIRIQNSVQLLLSTITILLTGYILSFVSMRADLTQEKRYTLNPSTKKILSGLPEGLLVKVYLEGDMPIAFKRLRNSTQDMLDEFRLYSDNRIDYQFIDPFVNQKEREKNPMIEDLYNKGLQPTNVKMKDDKGNLSEKMIMPGAIVSYNDKVIPVNLLSKNVGMAAEVNLNNSIQNLEYQLINALWSVTRDSVENIAIIEGHGELESSLTADLTRELEISMRYRIYRGQIDGKAGCLDPYRIIIIAKPTVAFSEEDKFVIDQYIMNGGKVIWLIDQVNIELDSLSNGSSAAFINNTNLDDQLFRYGVRINPVLVQDVQCSSVPVNISLQGQPPKFVPAPFLYLPLASPAAENAVSRNLNLIRCEFANTIDTVGTNDGIRKSVLLRSSSYTKLTNAPAMISLSDIKKQHERKDFNTPSQPMAMLLEGTFSSVFRNRMTDHLKIKGSFSFRESSKPTAMVVIADGDVIKNNIRRGPYGMQIQPLGLDRFSGQTYGNKDFILNVINYLSDGSDLISLRNKEVKLRLLDKTRIRDEKIKWQTINTILPILLVAAVGILLSLLRKRKFSR